jgi:hypothetical protein
MCLVVVGYNPTDCTKTRYVFSLRVIGYEYSTGSLRVYLYSSFLLLSIHNTQLKFNREPFLS